MKKRYIVEYYLPDLLIGAALAAVLNKPLNWLFW